MSAAVAALLAVAGWSAAAVAVPLEALRLRQEYNLVAAGIDTLAREHGTGLLDRLPDGRGADQLPTGHRLALVYWADDEAEVFLNGYRIGETRLTPVRVEVPALYLAGRNQLRVHAWDTDRVESGFVAGLYLVDARGDLRPVLVTGERDWSAGVGKAQEIYYAHSVPDVPGARVIWGDQLFGEVWLEAWFDAGRLRQAAGAPGLRPDPGWVDRGMAAQEMLARLGGLQERRRELDLALRGEAPAAATEVAYAGGGAHGLAFTTGPAEALAERPERTSALDRFQEWREGLPAAARLLYRPPRPLKGSEATTPPRVLPPSAAGPEDRRADYRPPPEHGPGGLGGGSGSGTTERPAPRAAPWAAASVALGLAVYSTAVGRQWWRILSAEVWTG